MEEINRSASRHIIINNDLDVIVARLRAREVAREMGFGTIDQARISLAAGELARILANKLNERGEIIISGINVDGHLGIQVISVGPHIDANETFDLEETEDLHKAISLVDKGIVEDQSSVETRVTLMKWLQEEVVQ